MMLEMLTLCRAQYKSTCIIICTLSPKYRCATVLYSTRAWKASLPRMVDIVSTRKREATPARAPKRMNAIVGL